MRRRMSASGDKTDVDQTLLTNLDLLRTPMASNRRLVAEDRSLQSPMPCFSLSLITPASMCLTRNEQIA
jgi:hypothetical protein